MITREAVKKLADNLGVEVCAIQAVIDVETKGDSFLPDGRPVILFEGHIFWKELKKLGIDPTSQDKKYANVLYPKWDRTQYKGGAKEYDRLALAKQLNEPAALMSASYGLFQIMGFNYPLCGVGTVFEFVDKQANIDSQFELAASFIRKAGHIPALKAKDWSEFARRYNGPAYAENQYDVKLQKAYEKCKAIS